MATTDLPVKSAEYIEKKLRVRDERVKDERFEHLASGPAKNWTKSFSSNPWILKVELSSERAQRLGKHWKNILKSEY